jgi:alpha-D-xyloside xylohydrolase
MISIWPIMRPGGANWQEMHDRGALLGNQATYNAFDAAARALYWQHANAGLFAHGIDAWWCDCTEPFEADWNGAIKPEPEARLRINTEEAKRYLDPEYINAYSLLHSQGIYEGQRAVTDAKRVVNLTRSAYMGQQRYATITWSGDIVATWETLHKQIAEGLNFCVTGSPYWTVDVGAFFVKHRPDLWFWRGDYDDGVADLGYRELFVRWFQYATFLPMLRAHGTDTPRETMAVRRTRRPDVRGARKVPAPALSAAALYLLAGRLDHPPRLHNAAPVGLRFQGTIPRLRHSRPVHVWPGLPGLPGDAADALHGRLHAGRTRRQVARVYLPTDCDWWDFWTDARLSGGQRIVAAADLATIPLYVRAGSIVPIAPPMQYADEQPDAVLELHVYPGCDGRFQLYEDAGDGYDYERGAFATIDITWQDAAQRLVLDARNGAFPGMVAQRVVRVVRHGAPAETGVSRDVHYQGQRLEINL